MFELIALCTTAAYLMGDAHFTLDAPVRYDERVAYEMRYNGTPFGDAICRIDGDDVKVELYDFELRHRGTVTFEHTLTLTEFDYHEGTHR
jgi:hypothetical protein